MGFKARVFSETLILCVFLLLDTRNIVSGCRLLDSSGNEVDLSAPADGYAFVGELEIADNRDPGPLYNFTTDGITSIVQAPGEERKYLKHDFNGKTLDILISDDYKNWEEKENGTSQFFLRVVLKLDCLPQLVEFKALVSQYTNGYSPTFQEPSYKITLPMPLPAGYPIVGECGKVIEATDYDYSDDYVSDVKFVLSEGEQRDNFEVTALEREGKKWGVSLKTKNTLKIEEPVTLTVVATDVSPAEHNDPELESEVKITVQPDIDNSTPASPLFKEPIYILDIREEGVITPIEATLVEGYSVPYDVDLVYSHGEDLRELFDTQKNRDVITLTPKKPFADTEFSGNFGVLILEAKHPDSDRIGKTVIHVTLPGNYVTPPPTSTTETTILPCSCPTEETTYTTDTTKPTEEITQCPDVTSPTEVTCPEVTCPTEPSQEITQCPEVTSPTEVTCPEVTCAAEPTILPCTCPSEETTFPSDTTKPTEESPDITDTTKPTEESPDITGTTKPTEESPDIADTTKPTEGSPDITDTTKPTEESPDITDTTKPTEGTTESCVCTTEDTSVPNEVSTTAAPATTTTTTTTVNTYSCEPCDCTCGTPESSAAPPQEKKIYFRDPQAIVYIYQQQIGYIKTMSAFCIPDCKIVYEIGPGSLSDSLEIDRENGDISITKNIKESGLFDVTAVAEIEGNKYHETARVTLNLLTLQPCQNGSQWTRTLAVKNVTEGSESPYTVEKCDFVDGCDCAIVEVIPEKARDYFISGKEVVLNKAIDREDKELFPDQSNTDIILHLELNCESDVRTSYRFWDKRSRSAIDDIGTIEYDALRTVIVLRIQDVNDNRPQFNETSPLTVGYPSAEIANQLLPPYLTKIQATDIDFGENAIIKYRLAPDNQFYIHRDTGVIYPVAGAFKYDDTQITVYAGDSEGDGEPLEVNVKTLREDNLVVIRQTGSVLEDVDAVIKEISSITGYNIKLLSAAVIANDTDDDGRQLHNVKSVRESSNSHLQLIIYGLDREAKPIDYSTIEKKLEGQTNFTSESWSASSSNDKYEGNDTALLITVIVLAVIILLLLGGAGVAYLLYVRSRRNNSDDYYERVLKSSGRSSISEVDENEVEPATEKTSDYENLQYSSTTEVTQPSPQVSPHLSGVTTTKPDQEYDNVIALDEFDHGTVDSEDAASNGDVGENEEEGNYENTITRRKSVVTFNDNVERIEIEEI